MSKEKEQQLFEQKVKKIQDKYERFILSIMIEEKLLPTPVKAIHTTKGVIYEIGEIKVLPIEDIDVESAKQRIGKMNKEESKKIVLATQI